MRKVSVALLVVLALLLATTVGVLAVTNGQPQTVGTLTLAFSYLARRQKKGLFLCGDAVAR